MLLSFPCHFIVCLVWEMKKNKKIPNLGNEKRRLPIWEMQKAHTKKNKMQKKNLLKNAQNMTNLVKKEPNNLLAK